MQVASQISIEGKWKSPMKYRFFCDENITKKIQATFKKFGFQVDSVRNQKLLGMNNGDLLNYVNSHNFILITFDKDFLKADFSVNQGIIILDVNPNRDEFTIPLLETFLSMLKSGKISINEKILLNQEFLNPDTDKNKHE
jgi:predicted nuclease of predicted toxin-antitoxin system